MKTLRFGMLLALSSSIVQGATLHVSPEPLSSVPADRQFESIQAAADIVSPGDVVLVHSGVYRESVVVKKNGTRNQQIRFEAAPQSNVVVTGLDPITEWRKEESAENVYSVPWPYRFIPTSKTDAYPEDQFHRLVGRAEQVVANGYMLHQTLRREQLSAGAFYVDLAAQRLYISPLTGQDVPNAKGLIQVEASTRSFLWDSKGEFITIRGIHFQYAANRAQFGAVVLRGRGDSAEDCVFERMNSVGASFGAPDELVRSCTFQDNGQLGFGALKAHNLHLTDCTIRNNNVKGFDRQWEAGGDKIVLSRGVVLEKSRFISNHGPGIWFDIGNENATVRNCLIADNEDAGIFYEISYGLHAHDNAITGNGFASTAGAWGAQAGIVLSSSPNCVIERNLLVGNREGFNFREQARMTSRIDNSDERQQEPVWNHDEQIRNNVIAYNRDAQVRGWFGVSDQRHWPRPLQESGSEQEPAVSKEISLETLHLALSQNIYARDENQPLFIWGANWLRHKNYSTIPAIQADLHLEKGSCVAALRFRNYAARDFRLPGKSIVFRMKCYPRGQVPDVTVGKLKAESGNAEKRKTENGNAENGNAEN